MDAQDGAPAPTPLAQRVDAGADAAEIAEAVAAVWCDVDVALRPIVGQRGVVALFHRSLHLSAVQHAWLAPSAQDTEAELGLAALTSRFAAQPAPQALDGGNHLLDTFRQLLDSLIGASLTERLLRTAWGPPMGGHPPQDLSS